MKSFRASQINGIFKWQNKSGLNNKNRFFYNTKCPFSQKTVHFGLRPVNSRSKAEILKVDRLTVLNRWSQRYFRRWIWPCPTRLMNSIGRFCWNLSYSACWTGKPRLVNGELSSFVLTYFNAGTYNILRLIFLIFFTVQNWVPWHYC